MPPTLRQLTRQAARRLVIAKQHLADDTPLPIRDLIQAIGCVQLDPISTVARSHKLVLWSRLGTFDEAELERLLWEERSLFEYWAHAASIVPMRDYPVHQWYMRRARTEGRLQKWLAERDIIGLDAYILDELRRRGPLLSREIDDDTQRYQSAWWSGRHVPRVLQHLWTQGDVMVVGRQGKQRIWGLAEDYLPEWVPTEPAWPAERVTRCAVQVAVRALGAATPAQIKAHYTRRRYPGLPRVLDELTSEGVLERVVVTENGEPLPGEWYLHTEDVPLLNEIQNGVWVPHSTTLLSPFDNLICDRDRTEQLFDFRFRIEIYVPKEKREYGYYVLPILHGDRLVGRIDPAYDRDTNTLHVNNVYREPGSLRNKRLLREIRRAVERLAGFLGAERIEWGRVPDEWSALREG